MIENETDRKRTTGWIWVPEFFCAAGIVGLAVSFIATRELSALLATAFGVFLWWLVIKPLRVQTRRT